jgi:hypothetical protein
LHSKVLVLFTDRFCRDHKQIGCKFCQRMRALSRTN